MKRIIAILLLTVTLLSAFSLTAFADDNAQSGEGTTHAAADGYGWYNSYQYMWKVTVYVGKTDQVTKQSNLLNDFYRIGTVIMKKTGWTLSSKAIFGDKTKPDYYGGQSMVQTTNPYAVIEDASCPKIPIACGGNIGTVKEYFGSTGTMNTILSALATKSGTTVSGLFSGKQFTIGGNKRSGWNSDYILPNGTTNRVPWVIVYEPVILMHLKDKVTLCAFTATEFALAQQYGWYDWNYSRGKGQSVSILPYKHLPTSVQLEESWFGYPVYNVTDDRTAWSIEDIIKGGGWGMRWLNIAVKEAATQIDYGCYFTSVETPKPNGYGQVTVTWKNYKQITGTVLCELYRGTTKIWSGNKSFTEGQGISQTFNVFYPGTSSQILTAKINYANKDKETDPNDNMRTRTVTPVGNSVIDFGAYIIDIESSPNADDYGTVTVQWWNWEDEEGTALCELYRDSTLVWSGYKTIDGFSYVDQTFNIYYSGTTRRTITAKINYEYRNDETDPNDNIDTESVTPVKTTDTTYDFSVSNLSVTPDPVTQGEQATVTFISDNWNHDVAYDNILVEVLVGDTVVKSEKVHFDAYGRNNHTYFITMSKLGDQTVTARINWANRNLESRVANNSTAKTVKVVPYYEFSVSSMSLSDTEVETGDEITVTFITDSWDRYNNYKNIPVEVLLDGKVVYSEKLDYAAYARKNHSITINVGNVSGTFPVVARVNWADHANEAKTNNNATDTFYVTVKDSIDLSIQYVSPNADYKAGTDVITSFWIYNNSTDTDIIPTDNNTVSFEAYYYKNGVKTVISSQAWMDAVIPANDKNLVWFKWRVPSNLSGTTVYVVGTINSGNTISESVMTNNKSSFSKKIAAYSIFETPDTQYEREKPVGFTKSSNPSTSTLYGNWWQYVYENGAFTKKTYRIYYYVSTKTIEPATGLTQEKISGVWNMKSGYGISVKFYGYVRTYSGYAAVTSDMYTDAQYVTAAFPEFYYSHTKDNARTLVKSGSYWIFRENGEYGNVHFTPLWYPDGDYVVSLKVADIWTPGGMITTTANTGKITIAGSAYDDWFVGR